MVLATTSGEQLATGFRHEMTCYQGIDGLGTTVVPFVREGLAAGERVHVAMPPDRLAFLADALGGDAALVELVDMDELGRNPARIIPAWRRILDEAGDAPVRGVGEPVWAGRRPQELDEAVLHESLLNLAFDGGPAWRLLCPYDVSALDGHVVEEAMRNHPVLGPGATPPMPDGPVDYAGRDHGVSTFAIGLPPVPDHATTVAFGADDFSGLRALVRRAAGHAGLVDDAVDDLVLAAHEVASNSVLHGGGAGTLATWQQGPALILDISDAGSIDDPLVGRRTLEPGSEHGRGVWLANQLCDLVQVRSRAGHTEVRLFTWL